jgi:hypothetical protein
MTEQRAKRILELERFEKLKEWDKANPIPKEPTYKDKVSFAVSDKDWLRSCINRAAYGEYHSNVFNITKSAIVKSAMKPCEDHVKKRDAYADKLKEEDRLTLIRMLKQTK